MLSFYYPEVEPIISGENSSKEINKDRNLLNGKIEQLISEFNNKWMERTYISCERPFVENEYPLRIKLNEAGGRKKE